MPTITKELVADLKSKGDTFIDSTTISPSGDGSTLVAGITSAGRIFYSLLQIKLPEAPENAGIITQVRLGLYAQADEGTLYRLQLRKCEQNYKAGQGINAGAGGQFPGDGANWETYDGVRPWAGVSGNPTAPSGAPQDLYDTYSNDDGDIGAVISDYYIGSGVSGYIYFDITAYCYDRGIDWGGTVDAFIKHRDDSTPVADEYVTFTSADGASNHPVIEVTYDIKEDTTTPEGEDAMLSIDPNPANPEQPLLKWKRPKNTGLRRDTKGGYVVIRDIAPITDYASGNLVKRESSALEYVDGDIATGTTTSAAASHLVDSGATFQTDGVSVGDYVHNTTDDTWAIVTAVNSQTDLTLDVHIMATGEDYVVMLGDGLKYYYRILICNETNYVDGTGKGAMSGMTVVGAPQFSNEVVMEKPKVTSFVESGADYTWTIWEKHTVNTTCQAPTLNNVQNVAYQHDWQGDGTETGWKELEIPSNTDSTAYRYTSFGGGLVTPKVRVRNTLGFWSAQYSLSQIGLTALLAFAECRASPKKVDAAEGFRIRGDESQDQNADGTITKYEFSLQRSSDSKYWDAGTTTWKTIGAWPDPFNDQGTTPYLDIIAGAVDHTVNVTYTCSCRVTGLKGVVSAAATDTVEGIIETPVDIRSGLSSDVLIGLSSMMRDAIVTKRTKLEGTTGIRIFEGLRAEDRTLEGVSRRIDWLDDLLVLDAWQENQTLLKYFYDEPTNVRYITFRITRKQERRRGQYRASWAIQIDVESKTT